MRNADNVTFNEVLDAQEELAVESNGDSVGTSRTLTFDEWMDALDALTMERYGLNVADLPALDFQATYRAGISPRACLDAAIAQFLKDVRIRRHLEVATLFDESSHLGTRSTSLPALDEVGLHCIADLSDDGVDPLTLAYGALPSEEPLASTSAVDLSIHEG